MVATTEATAVSSGIEATVIRGGAARVVMPRSVMVVVGVVVRMAGTPGG